MSKRKAPASRSAEPSPKRQKVAIDDVDVTTEEGLNKLTVVDLRTLLKQKELSVNGKKPELVARLLEAKDVPVVAAANGEEAAAAPAANGEGEEAPKEAEAVVEETAAAPAAAEEAPAAAVEEAVAAPAVVEEAAAPAAAVEEAVAAPAEAEAAPAEVAAE
eukprot:TRINITY_DN243_c0_g1_i1.p2 TRINITY_DN243_c0_g1~~TRINITY_DN243_c0_g1_i1.p2  ORF type:complete len:161 (+),score=111.83 TRINITY_DN243_c0_g1_i1:131-613(+)